MNLFYCIFIIFIIEQPFETFSIFSNIVLNQNTKINNYTILYGIAAEMINPTQNVNVIKKDCFILMSILLLTLHINLRPTFCL
jgi:hypothetical protein